MVRQTLRSLSKQWILLILVAFFVFFAVFAKGFFSIKGLKNIAVYTSEPLLLALGQTFVIISGGIDLSVGAVLGFCGVVSAFTLKGMMAVSQNIALNIIISVLAGMSVGIFLGTINGAIISKLSVPPFVVTLGMLGIARGVTYILTSGHSIIGLPAELSEIGNFQLFRLIPASVLITIVLVLMAHFLLSKTRLGRYTYSIGGNKQASVRAGVPVDRYTIIIYALSGFMAAAKRNCAGKTGSWQKTVHCQPS